MNSIDLIEAAGLSIALLFVVAGIVALFRLFTAAAPSRSLSPAINCQDNRSDGQRFAIIVPCLFEQAVIGDTLRYLSELDYPSSAFRIVPVTTVSETPHEGLSTRSIVDDVANEINEPLNVPLVRPIHVPFSTRFMADQVNYAARYLFEVFDEGCDPERVFIYILNADSRPAKDTLLAASDVIKNHNVDLLQQPSVYLLPKERIRNWFQRGVMTAASLWQTRWSLSVEVSRWGKASMNGKLSPQLGSFHYLVGHGLFVRLKTFVTWNYLPRCYNEDACYGVIHSLARTNFGFVSPYDRALVPSGISDLAIQQTQWALGPFRAFQHLERAIRLRTGAGRWSKLVVVSAATIDGINWMFGPLLMLALGVMAAWTGSIYSILLFLIALFAYLILPGFLVLWRLPVEDRPNPTDVAVGLALMPVFYLIHGYAALAALSMVLSGRAGPDFVARKTRREPGEPVRFTK